MGSRHALIDGDSFAYRCAAAVERTKYMIMNPEHDGYSPVSFDTHKEALEAHEKTGCPIWSRREVGKLKDAADSLEFALERSIARCQAGVFHIYLGGSGPTFRDHIARIRKYKGNRIGKQAPEHLEGLRNYLVRCWGAKYTNGEEVDDVLSYTSREVASNGATPIIVGNDKDLDQIPGEHYDWVKDTLYRVDDAGARFRLWMQVLHGDVADNIIGCCGIGPVKAEAIVLKYLNDGDERMWSAVCEAYEKSQGSAKCLYTGLDPSDVATEMYNLVRLKQSRHEEHAYLGLFPKKKESQNPQNP